MGVGGAGQFGQKSCQKMSGRESCCRCRRGGVEDYGAVVNRARLLMWPIVADQRCSELSCDGGWHVERG